MMIVNTLASRYLSMPSAIPETSGVKMNAMKLPNPTAYRLQAMMVATHDIHPLRNPVGAGKPSLAHI